MTDPRDLHLAADLASTIVHQYFDDAREVQRVDGVSVPEGYILIAELAACQIEFIVGHVAAMAAR